MRRIAATAVPLTLLVLMTVLRIADLSAARADLLRAGEARAANLAAIASSYLGEAFASTDAPLRQLVVHARRIGGPEARDADWLPSLAAARAGVPVGAISVTDADGIIRHSTQPLIVGQSRRDETIVRALLSATDDVLIAGEPYRTLNPAAETPAYIVPVGRKLTDAQGRTTGLVIASFLPAAPRPFLRSLDVGQRGRVRVIHPGGVLLYEEPSQVDRAGARVLEDPVFVAARQNGTGVLRASLGDGGAMKLTAYRTRIEPPLIVVISLDQAELLTAWRTDTWRSGVLFGVLSVMLIGVQLVLVREMAARSAALAREQVARRDAEAANAVKDQFLMTLSHELRTPLTAISGWARMLSMNVVNEAGRTKAVQAIERNAQMQQRLVDDLLDVSRVMAGKLPLTVAPVSIARVAQIALETIRPAAESKGVELRGEVQPDAGTISGDAERLQQIVWNLLSNAVKFTPAGGRVVLDVHRSGESHVRIVVSDTGIGVSPEFLPHIFERFAQEDASTTRAHGGLGLGLSIVRSLVELHGGTVVADSDGPGRGTRITVTLPTRQVAVDVDQPLASTITMTSAHEPGHA